MVKVLLALTSYNETFTVTVKNWCISLLKLYILLKYSEKGYEIQLASETGTFGWDDHSVVPDFLNGEDKEIFDNANSEFNVALKI